MITIAYINGRSCPVAYCDHCSERINAAGEGLYYTWQWEAEEADRSVQFVHKRCANEFQDARGGRSKWPDQELGLLTGYLADNLKISDPALALSTES